MPRPNPVRSIGAEQRLARRIKQEREARGWTYDKTAEMLTVAGCPIQGSAIFKIENHEPPRRITVDELAAFSRVWAIPMDRLCGEAG